MSELRDRIAVALSGTEGHFGDKLDAVMAVVRGVEQDRDEARASVEHLRGDFRHIRKDRDRLRLAWWSARRRADGWRAAATTEIPRWDDDAVVQRFGFLQPDQCGKCGETHPQLAEVAAERDRLAAEVAMHMRHRMEIEQILKVELGTEVEDGADAGFVADVALAFQRRRDELDATQGERDELAAQRDEWLSEFDKVRASAVALPENAEELLTERLADKASAIVTMDDAGPEFDAQYAAIVALDLVRSWWRPATVDATTTPDGLQPAPNLGAAKPVCSACPTTHTYTGDCRYEIVPVVGIEVGATGTEASDG